MNGSQRTSIGIMTRSNTDFVPNWDVPVWVYFNVSGITDAFDCQNACDQDDKCRSWIFVSTRTTNNNCFLKTGIPYLQSDPTCASGIKQMNNNLFGFILIEHYQKLIQVHHVIHLLELFGYNLNQFRINAFYN
jgi:hypothetical protein